MTHRLRRSTVLVAWATTLAIAAGVRAEAIGHDGGSPSGDPTPRWLGDVPGFGRIAPDETPVGVPVTLDGCTVANPLLKERPARVRPFVPAHYRLGENNYFGPGVATTIVAYMSCRDVQIDGRGSAPALLSLIAVQVVADPIGTGPVDALYDVYNRSTLNFLPSSSWYLLAAQTNHRGLAARLRGAGLPVERARRLAYRSNYRGRVKSDSIVVRSRGGNYRVATTTMLADVFTHNHDWFFWHDAGPEPASRTGFFLHLHAMDDSSCGYHLSPAVQRAGPCGAKVRARRRSSIARFLGGRSRRTPYAFNHPPSSARGYIDIPAQ